ncbi:uncharacterized protein LOC122401628 [Colletes gigas]|uniref:uncharacterized protein LOC122401628 n=1 Tax=Colletes gigas TaxID=935657 RepID=UPI001C9A34D4|nr:uncharacterized protein LOC122401628 [Colletes gigas]
MLQQYRGVGHNCQGPRCVCQRYENGELAAVVMNQNRSNQERDDSYQNVSRGSRAFQNRLGGSVQVYPNLNPNYQNPVDIVRNYNRNRQPQEPEENIYERLDNDDDDENADNREVGRNEPVAQNQNNLGDHTYERIDDRYSCANRMYSRCYKYHILNHIAVPNFLNDVEPRSSNQYDQPRQIYLDSSRLSSQFCQNRLGRLGRNCFSTENIAYASTGRTVYPLGYSCMCSFCRHLDSRYLCQHCHNLHNRLRYQDGLAGNSRHYIYQLPRNCRCPFCRGEYSYVKLPVTSCRSAEPWRMECHCRNPSNCSCRCKVLANCNSTTQVGRYLDWINRSGPSVNNPLYATIHIGRPCVSALGNAANGGNSVEPGASTSNASASASASVANEPGTSSNVRPMFSPNNPSTSRASVCSANRATERQHTCDDSCIRNQSGSVAGICQFFGRCERAECNHSRLSVHWWVVNKWLPSWNPNNFDRNMDAVPAMEEESRNQHDSDSDEA